MTLHVSLAFASLKDKELDDFATGVHDKMNGNASYPTPPATMAVLDTARSDFEKKVAKADSGGPPDTVIKDAARQTLIGILRQEANYVEGTCNNDLATLLSSGFEAANTERRRLPLEQATSLVIRNGTTAQLIARVAPVKNTKLYEGRAKTATGDWMPSVFTGDSQHIIFDGLTPGTIYTIQVRALGGSTGQSDWSDPSSHMCM